MQFSDEVTRIDQLARRTTAVGIVTDVRQLTDGRSRIDLLVDEVWDKQEALELERPLRLRLNVEQSGDQVDLLPQDRIRFHGRLRQPRLFGNPGEFHWPRYVISQNIDMTSWVENIDDVEVVAEGKWGLRRLIVQWRTRVAGFIVAHVAEENSPLVRALVLGEGRQLSETVRKTLASAGVSRSVCHFGIAPWNFRGIWLSSVAGVLPALNSAA